MSVKVQRRFSYIFLVAEEKTYKMRQSTVVKHFNKKSDKT
jgi:hypothetical protein